MRTLLIAAGILLSSLGTTPATAEDEAPLYRVELVVFADISAGAGAEERWPQPDGLAYPEHWTMLDAPPPMVDTDPDEAGDFSAAFYAARGSAAPGESPAAASAGVEPNPEQNGSTPWQSLPESDWRLADSAARLQRSGRYQILLHKAWLQPLENRSKNPALVIAGGEQFGEHHELEGYITLSQDRYVHAQMEFWLSRFRFGSGLEATLFSPLPTPPHRRRPALDNAWFGDAGAAPDGAAETRSGTTGGGVDSEGFYGVGGDTGASGSGFSGGSVPFGTRSGFGPAAGFDDRYVPSQIFVLKQQLRVESGKLTYIDHPLMGALLLVAPLQSDPEE